MIVEHFYHADRLLRSEDGLLRTLDGLLHTEDEHLRGEDKHFHTVDGLLHCVDGYFQRVDEHFHSEDGLLHDEDGLLHTVDGLLRSVVDNFCHIGGVLLPIHISSKSTIALNSASNSSAFLNITPAFRRLFSERIIIGSDALCFNERVKPASLNPFMSGKFSSTSNSDFLISLLIKIAAT
jgi:hypothetical protein